VERVAEAKSHPHGGPPGQLKKQMGLQTGAEVVHGSRPGSTYVASDRAETRGRKVEREVKVRPEKNHVAVQRGGGSKGHSKAAHGQAKSVTAAPVHIEHAKPAKMQAPAGPASHGGNPHVKSGGAPQKVHGNARPQGGKQSQGGKGHGKGKG
jgi:hypothetical protein